METVVTSNLLDFTNFLCVVVAAVWLEWRIVGRQDRRKFIRKVIKWLYVINKYSAHMQQYQPASIRYVIAPTSIALLQNFKSP